MLVEGCSHSPIALFGVHERLLLGQGLFIIRYDIHALEILSNLAVHQPIILWVVRETTHSREIVVPRLERVYIIPAIQAPEQDLLNLGEYHFPVFGVLVRPTSFALSCTPGPEIPATSFIGGLLAEVFEHLFDVLFLVFGVVGLYFETVVDDGLEAVDDLHDVVLLVDEFRERRIGRVLDGNLGGLLLSAFEELVVLIHVVLLGVALLVC